MLHSSGVLDDSSLPNRVTVEQKDVFTKNTAIMKMNALEAGPSENLHCYLTVLFPVESGCQTAPSLGTDKFPLARQRPKVLTRTPLSLLSPTFSEAHSGALGETSLVRVNA